MEHPTRGTAGLGRGTCFLRWDLGRNEVSGGLKSAERLGMPLGSCLSLVPEPAHWPKGAERCGGQS